MTTLQTVRALYAAGLTKDAVDQIVQITTQADAGVTDAAAAQADATTGIADAATAQTTADYAGHSVDPNPATYHEWGTADDGMSTFTVSDPTRNLGYTLKDKSGTTVATRVVTGTLTSAAGTVALTDGSDSANAGYSSAYAKVDDGTVSARADITFPLLSPEYL